ncbi:hypothetical protein PInf_021101 [Phytophthora infestans]|nr:hypothetical protein PInf_021101 [Phytophthora infestans]
MVSSSVSSTRVPSSATASSRPTGQSTALISAYLLKQSAGKWNRKRWNQRWFVLDRDSGLLRYFRHASPLETVPLRQDAHGVVSLKQGGVSLVVQGDLPSGVPTPFCFTILVEGQRELRICADTNAEFRQWTATISTVISPMRASPSVSEAKVALPSSVASRTSSTSSAVEEPSLLQSSVVEMEEKKLETAGKGKDSEPREMIEQMCSLVIGNKSVLIALNPVLVLVRFGNVSVWLLIALLANVYCVWLLWFRSPDVHAKQPLSPVKPCRTASVKDGRLQTTATGTANDSGISPDKSSSKLRTQSASLRARASSSSTEESPKRAAFLGQINGVRISAGASLKMCAPSSSEVVTGSWAQVEATRFNVRQGPNYRKTKLKAASAAALLELVAVDVYRSDVKADNVGSIVDLSALKPESGKLDLFIVNCQVPSYQPSNPLWGEKQGDGPGFNFVTYFAIPPAVREMLDAPGESSLQAVRLLKDFMQPQSWVSERFKAIGIVVNPQEQNLGRAERRLLETYNGQPILTRPQHRFYHGDGYFEVDVDAHDFNYIARKGLVGVSTHACNMILDFGFVLEGQEDNELPEQILGCVRLCKVDLRQAPWLS